MRAIIYYINKVYHENNRNNKNHENNANFLFLQKKRTHIAKNIILMNVPQSPECVAPLS